MKQSNQSNRPETDHHHHRRRQEAEVSKVKEEECGRERLKKHRSEVAGKVWIPEIWGQEELLKDWIDCTAFDTPLMPNSRIMSAREALVQEGRRANARTLRIENTC
ncbi:protein BIC1 [Mercurialis annua]|uniref:protein BIC1 n=1 Tax=Mercurialis annua TaxID=3986 RepID=UPI00215F1374|nr:protein BIC1 [Mercurialis annua]